MPVCSCVCNLCVAAGPPGFLCLCSLLSLGEPNCGPLGPLRSLCSLCCKQTESLLQVFLCSMCSMCPLLDLRALPRGPSCTVISVFPAGPPSLSVFLCSLCPVFPNGRLRASLCLSAFAVFSAGLLGPHCVLVFILFCGSCGSTRASLWAPVRSVLTVLRVHIASCARQH